VGDQRSDQRVGKPGGHNPEEVASKQSVKLAAIEGLPHTPRLAGVFALAGLLVGTGLMVLSDSGRAHAVGIACLVAFAASAFLLATTTPLEEA
jgi:hypothetical protein